MTSFLTGRSHSWLAAGSAECAEKVIYVGLPLCARADDFKAERVVDHDHGYVGDRVLRPHPHSLRTLALDPFEHRGLYPFGEPEPSMRRVDAGVLLKDGGRIRELEGDFRTADTGPGRVTDEHGPPCPARLDQCLLKLSDELSIDDHVIDIEILPRSCSHDAVKRRSVGAKTLGKHSVDQLQAVPKLPRPCSPCPGADHGPVDVGKHQFARAVHPAD